MKGIILLLLLKSLAILSILTFKSPLLLSHTLKLSLLITGINYTFALFLSSSTGTNCRDFGVSVLAGWFLVFVAGGNPFDLNSVTFSLFLGSVAFNFLTLKPFLNSSLLKNVSNLNFLKASKDPLQLSLLFASLGSLVGSLLTSLIVILDWDVEWKRFPIPNMVGCIFGEFCGLVISLIILKVIKTNKCNKTKQ